MKNGNRLQRDIPPPGRLAHAAGMLLEALIVVLSFALGYGLREFISRRRRAESRRRWATEHSL